MNLFRYIDRYGNDGFDEVPFNEVDNAIFSALSYINFEGIVSSNCFSGITIAKAGEMFFQKYNGEEKNIFPVKQAIKLLRYMKDTKRYGNLLLYNYVYEESGDEQFSALTIEIHSRLVYVSFEGTDHLVSGWKEDFMLSYMFPVKAQRRAIDYVNRRFRFQRKEIILGGHSKGGNLALVAGMYANFGVRDKIIKIYNNDGPGLLEEQFQSEYYQRIESKLIHFVPSYSIVGLLLWHKDSYQVVRTAKKGLFAHDLFTWVVEDKAFMRTELDSFSKSFSDNLIVWLSKYSMEQRERFVYSLFDIFERANVKSILDIMDNKKLILHLISESKEMADGDKGILKDFIFMLFRCFKDVKKDELMSLIERK